MLVACRLTGLSALERHLQASTRSRDKPMRQGLVSEQNSDGSRWTTSRSQGIETTTVEPPER